MRSFLPIKGPGGRTLTPNEKVALLILGFTLVMCVLTLTAGERAYADGPPRNPVFGAVAALSRTLGGGIVALYALVLVWSALIFFKGERVARVGPLPGRVFAAVGVTIGVSGVLGLGNLQSAGSLGQAVGSAFGNTFGDAVGFPLLLVLLLLGFHLAGQGAWTALRVPAVAVAGGAGVKAGFGSESGRFGGHPSMPDDGDPTADERSLAVTRAMEEIERSQGVTIVDVEPEEEEDEARASIGEEVEAAGAPAPDTEEDEVRRGLDYVHETLGARYVAEEDDEDEVQAAAAVEEDVVEEVDEEVEEHAEADEEEDEFAAPPEAREEIRNEAYVAYGEEEDDDVAEADEDDGDAHIYEEISAEEDEEPVAEADDEEDAYEVYEDAEEEEEIVEARPDEEYASPTHGLVPVPPAEEEPSTDEWAEAPAEEEAPRPAAARVSRYLWDEEETESRPDETPVEAARDEEPAEATEPQADGFAGDPYAQGGLVKRLQAKPATDQSVEDERPYTSFDWPGHPLD